MRVFISGIAGVLGSSLANHFARKGFRVTGNDIVREEEAWRLEEEVEYLWKSTWDLQMKDILGCDIIIDCSIGFADRPFGIKSPLTTLVCNLVPSLKILEIVRKLEVRPTIIYPSSFNACYSHRVITEKTLPDTTSLYGWTKGAAENLYRVYHRAYRVPSIITRVGSCFGEKGRSDELPHRLIIFALKYKKFHLRSPYTKRLWTYAGDAIRFYDRLLEKIDECVGLTLHCCGNAKDEILTNVELAEKVRKLLPLEYELGEYEPGEENIDFTFDYSFTKSLLGWKPKYSVDEGLKRTVKWYRENMWRYRLKRTVEWY